MDKKNEIASSASQLFSRESVRGTGVDHISTVVGASTRTLYKHFGSRDGLVVAALEARHRAFMEMLEQTSPDTRTVASLFDTLAEWSEKHGASGCLLLRARHEYGGSNPEIVALVRHQKEAFLTEIARRVCKAIGHESAQLSAQIWMLVEGATAVASVQDLTVIGDAKAAALTLVTGAGRHLDA